MSRKYKFHNTQGIYFVSFAVVYWIDVFIRNRYKEIFLSHLDECINKKNLDVYAWCIMTSHVHLIIGSPQGELPEILRYLKSRTAFHLRKEITNNIQESRAAWMLWLMKRAGRKNSNNKNNFQFWQQHNKPIELYSNHVIQQKLDYIHNNPVEAGIVDYPHQYLYSSARNYCGEKGLLEVKLL